MQTFQISLHTKQTKFQKQRRSGALHHLRYNTNKKKFTKLKKNLKQLKKTR